MANWRDTYRPARFVVLDGRIALVLLPTLMHFRWYTVALTAAVAAFLYYFERRREMDVASSLRWIRSKLCGRIRYPRAMHKIRRPIDYDRRD